LERFFSKATAGKTAGNENEAIATAKIPAGAMWVNENTASFTTNHS